MSSVEAARIGAEANEEFHHSLSHVLSVVNRRKEYRILVQAMMLEAELTRVISKLGRVTSLGGLAGIPVSLLVRAIINSVPSWTIDGQVRSCNMSRNPMSVTFLAHRCW